MSQSVHKETQRKLPVKKSIFRDNYANITSANITVIEVNITCRLAVIAVKYQKASTEEIAIYKRSAEKRRTREKTCKFIKVTFRGSNTYWINLDN